MEKQEMLTLLEQVQQGALTPEQALLQMKLQPFQDLGYAKVDHHRGLRQGAQEVIYGAGKTAEQIDGILTAMEGRDATDIIVTRMNQQAADYVAQRHPMDYDPMSRLGIVRPTGKITAPGYIAVVSGGTSDMAVCEEAARTAIVVGGLVDCPVIAVPTSVGYGANFNGLSALLSMLNSCASGVSVVNIDNGFGAGYLASMINHMGGSDQ